QPDRRRGAVTFSGSLEPKREIHVIASVPGRGTQAPVSPALATAGRLNYHFPAGVPFQAGEWVAGGAHVLAQRVVRGDLVEGAAAAPGRARLSRREGGPVPQRLRRGRRPRGQLLSSCRAVVEGRIVRRSSRVRLSRPEIRRPRPVCRGT